MSALIEKLASMIEKMFEGTVFHLIDIKSSVSKRFSTLIIYIDREDGFLTHQDCMDWSGRFQDLIDRKELITRDYRLEISSPGISRPLKEKWQFRKNLEKELKVCFCDLDESRKEIIGALIEANDAGIILAMKNDRLKIPWDKIHTAKVQTPW
jgi:ribosome maturation factor RimP